jgi:hypothetical protein
LGQAKQLAENLIQTVSNYMIPSYKSIDAIDETNLILKCTFGKKENVNQM